MDCAHSLLDRVLARAVCTLGVFLATATAASAQAWVPPAGFGEIHFVYQNVDNTGHLLTDGSLLPGFDSVSRGLLIAVDYAVTDRFSFTAAVPYIGAKYLGPEPSFFGLELDDCLCWNRGWQDVTGTARYNLFTSATGAFALTPSVSVGVPSHDYNFFGEAVIGRNLFETRVAIDAGQRLDAISTNLFVSGRYAYAFVEKVLDLPNNRSNAEVSLAFLFTQRLQANVTFFWQVSHGGLTNDDFLTATNEVFVQFDRILRDNSFHVGAGVAYSFPRFDLFGSYIEFADGTDTHTGRLFQFGIGWPFEF